MLNGYLCKLLWSEADGEKQSEISTHCSVALLTSFVGVLPAAGAEQEEDDGSPFDSEVESENQRIT